jgi:hypothetical protein
MNIYQILAWLLFGGGIASGVAIALAGLASQAQCLAGPTDWRFRMGSPDLLTRLAALLD